MSQSAYQNEDFKDPSAGFYSFWQCCKKINIFFILFEVNCEEMTCYQILVNISALLLIVFPYRLKHGCTVKEICKLKDTLEQWGTENKHTSSGFLQRMRRSFGVFFTLSFSFPVTTKLHFHKTVKSTVEVGWYKWAWERKDGIEGVMEKGRQTEKVGDGGFSPLCTWVISPCLICSDRLPSMLWAALNCCRKHARTRIRTHSHTRTRCVCTHEHTSKQSCT